MTTEWHVRRAVAALRGGGVIVHATEAVFGLAAAAADAAACARVALLKRRPGTKPFIVIGASVEQVAALVSLESPVRGEILQSWPGPHTWVLPARPGCPAWLRDGHGRLAVRVTAHPQAARLCALTGPLISTSANPGARRPARSLRMARHYFGANVDYYLPGNLGGASRPSRIRDGWSGAVLRA